MYARFPSVITNAFYVQVFALDTTDALLKPATRLKCDYLQDFRYLSADFSLINPI